MKIDEDTGWTVGIILFIGLWVTLILLGTFKGC